MELATVTIATTRENVLHKRGVTPAEACIYARMHKKESGGQAISRIVIDGEAMTRVRTGIKAEKGERVPQFEEHERTDKEERERLRKIFSGTIRVGKDNVPALLAVFPNEMEQLPQTFAEVEQHLGEGVEILTQAQVEELAEKAAEVKAKPGKVKAAKPGKGKKAEGDAGNPPEE